MECDAHVRLSHTAPPLEKQLARACAGTLPEGLAVLCAPEAIRSFLRERNVGTEVFDEHLKDIMSEMAEVTAAFGAHQIRTTRVPEVTSELLVA
jgi:hypothetical protein